MTILELRQLHLFLEILIYQVVNVITTRLSNFMSILNKFVEHAYNTFAVPCEKSRIVFLTFSIMNNIAIFPALFRFPVKLIFRIDVCLDLLQSASSFHLSMNN